MDSNNKKTARIVGVLFIVGTVAGILSVVFTGSIFNKQDLLMKVSANENQIIIGALCMLIMGFSLALVPILMYPIFKKDHEVLALGYVVFRGALETMTYIAMAVCWLILVVLSNDYVNAVAPDASNFQILSNLILGAAEQVSSITMIIFSLGAIMFYYLLFQMKLIPRWLSGWGLIAIVLYLIIGIFALFGSTFELGLLPLGLQEMVMAVWLIVKGFNSTGMILNQSKGDEKV